ncbi:MAG TPA: hypothetical protein VMU19_07425 [Bryobacteraceae bacterium]|nr:hypothetical protein [Bryobacteraceae bacterium]
MPASGPPVGLRQLLDEGITQLLGDADALSEQRAAREACEAGERARRETADRLNQAVRRMRQACEPEGVSGALLDAAAAFAGGAALFRVEGEMLRGDRARGAPEAAGDFRALELALDRAPALASAAATREPVVTATDPESVSPELAAFLGLPAGGRAAIFPVVSRDAAVALAFAWGEVETAAIELLAEAAGAVWSGIGRPAPKGLVGIAPALSAEAEDEEAAPSPWQDLSPEEQRVHLRAQRFARVEAARIRLTYGAEVQAGRAQRNLYAALAAPIDAARASFRKDYFEACPSMVDYLHLEFVRTLAHDDPELLGEDYPGVML